MEHPSHAPEAAANRRSTHAELLGFVVLAHRQHRLDPAGGWDRVGVQALEALAKIREAERLVKREQCRLRRIAARRYLRRSATERVVSERRLPDRVASLGRPCAVRTRSRVSRPGHRSVAHLSSSDSGGDPGGGDPPGAAPVAPPWFLAKFGHLAPPDQLCALHQLSDADKDRFSVYVAIAADDARKPSIGTLRPVGLPLAEFVASLRGGR